MSSAIPATAPLDVVDAHTHLLPGRLAAKIREFFDAHLPGRLAYPIDIPSVLDRHAREGVTAVWNLPYAHKPGIAAGLNESMLAIPRAMRDHAVEVVTGCTVHPGDDQPAAIVARAVDAGARVCKLHCSVGTFDADDPRLDPVWAYAGEVGLPVVVHAGHGVSGHTEPDELAPIARVAERWPDATVVIAHAGHRAHAATLDLLRRHPSLHADLTPVVDETVPLDAGDAAHFADRLLLGSDAPNTALTATVLLAQVASWGLGDEHHRAIVGGNARRLTARLA